MKNTLLETLKDYVRNFEEEFPKIAAASVSFNELKELTEAFSKAEIAEFQWNIKIHYGKMRYYPHNFAAREFMSNFMKVRTCCNNSEIKMLGDVFNIRNVIIPPDENNSIYHDKKKKSKGGVEL